MFHSHTCVFSTELVTAIPFSCVDEIMLCSPDFIDCCVVYDSQ